MKHAGSFRILNFIRSKNVFCIIVIFLVVFFCLNTFFGFVYYYLSVYNQFSCSSTNSTSQFDSDNGNDVGLQVEEPSYSLGDCLYFSYITATTVGYGDIFPVTGIAKAVVVIQAVISALYFAIMMSIITSKLLWPQVNTIKFSKYIVFDPQFLLFHVRIINTNSIPIIQPVIRISVTQHAVGDVIANVYELGNTMAKPMYLGRHDYTISFGKLNEDHSSECCDAHIVLGELKRAIKYQNQEHKKDSRFRVTLTISGSNGIQSIAEIKKYYADDFVTGTGFIPIEYKGRDDDQYGIVYSKIKNFERQFESVKDQRPLKI